MNSKCLSSSGAKLGVGRLMCLELSREIERKRLLNCYSRIVPRDREEGLSLRMLSCQLLSLSCCISPHLQPKSGSVASG